MGTHCSHLIMNVTVNDSLVDDFNDFSLKKS